MYTVFKESNTMCYHSLVTKQTTSTGATLGHPFYLWSRNCQPSDRVWMELAVLVATKQLYEWSMNEFLQELLPLKKVMSLQRAKVRSQRSWSQRSKQILPQFGRFRIVAPFWFTDSYEMMPKAWSDIHVKGVPIVSQCHLSNIKVIRTEISTILIRIRRFPTITSVWFHRWLRNYAQSFKWHGRCPFIFKIIF